MQQSKPILGIGTDHAGIELKNKIVTFLRNQGWEVRDFGAFSPEPCDYPDIAIQVAAAVSTGEVGRGILVCGSGIGMSIAANKVYGIRAALCTTCTAARLSREHNNANVLVLAGRDAQGEDPFAIVQTWLETPFSQAERHQRRLNKIHTYEQQQAIKAVETKTAEQS